MDINGDGRADMTWPASNTLKMWLTNANGTITTPADVTGCSSFPGWSPCSLSVGGGDFNGDGLTDLLWYQGYSATTPQLAIWLGLGDGTFNTASATSYSSLTGYTPYFADFNGDGKTDILWDKIDSNGRTQGQRQLWLSKGDGTFATSTNVGGQDGTLSGYRAHIGDFILGSIVQIAAAVLCAGPLAPLCVGLAAAAVTGITSGKLGLALKAGFISAVTAFAMFEVGNLTEGFSGAPKGGHAPLDFASDAHLFNIAGHALVGCASATANGGKCGSGALSGAVGSFAGPLLSGLDFSTKLVATSVLGGLASVAGGGKFANGALTAAFGYLFNEVGLVCRSIGTTGYSASHCGLFVFDRNSYERNDLRGAEIRAQFSLGADQTRFNTEFETWSDDRQTFWSGRGVYTVNPPAGMSQEDFEAVVMRDASSYRASGYNYWGPNSNSAAGYPLIMNGAMLPDVKEGWASGAVALDYWKTLRN